MLFKKVVVVCLIVFGILSIFCDPGEQVTPTPPTGTQESFGSFQVELVDKVITPGDTTPAFTSIMGTMYNAPSPPQTIFEEVMTVGECKLMKTLTPQCKQSCGSYAKCISKDSCQPFPDAFLVGKVTVDGFKNNNNKTTFDLKSTNKDYQKVNTPLDYPPFSEGDTITFSASGSESMSPFKLTAKGISPLVVLSDTILAADGQPVTIRWVPPKKPGISTISIRINISYHGANGGEIQCECEDDGELTIPAKLMDSLKTYGVAGWPLADITRKAIGTNETAKAKLVIQSMVTKWLTIPGIVSCNGNAGECPDGQSCVDRRCK